MHWVALCTNDIEVVRHDAMCFQYPRQCSDCQQKSANFFLAYPDFIQMALKKKNLNGKKKKANEV